MQKYNYRGELVTSGLQGPSGSNADTSSFVLNDYTASMTVLSSSYAVTAAFALNGGSGFVDTSSFATTASNTFVGNQTFTSSIFVSGTVFVNDKQFGQSNSGEVLTFSKTVTSACGMTATCSIQNNGDGSITILSGSARFYSNSGYSGFMQRYEMPTSSLCLLTNNVLNYIIADQNNGNPIYRVTLNVDEINESNIFPVVTVYRENTNLFWLDWDSLGRGLPNKLHQRLVKTERYARESGLILGTAGQYVMVTSGRVWVGANRHFLSTVNATDNVATYYHSGSAWEYYVSPAFDSSSYDTGTGTASLSPNRYNAHFVYRIVDDNPLTASFSSTYIVLGNLDASKLSDAQAAQPPANIPPVITAMGALIGRIIVQQGNPAAVQVDSAFSTHFSPSLVTLHSDLSNLDFQNSNHTGFVGSSQTSSLVLNSQTASMSVLSASYSTSASIAASSSYAVSASYSLTASYIASSETVLNPTFSRSCVSKWTALPQHVLTGFYAAAWSPELGIFAVPGYDGQMASSVDGVNWSIAYDGIGGMDYSSVAWAAELGLFVGTTAAYGYTAKSSDGVHWTRDTISEANQWNSLAWSPKLGMFAAVSRDGTNRVMTSTNGVTWVTRSAAENNQWYDVCWSPKLEIFAAVASSGTNRVMISPDGINWTSSLSSEQSTWRAICWADGLNLFVAVSQGGTNQVMTSADGTAWNGYPAAGAASWNKIVWSPELKTLVAVADGPGGGVMTSTNATSWSLQTAPNVRFNNIVWSKELGIFLATSWGVGSQMMISTPTERLTYTSVNSLTSSYAQTASTAVSAAYVSTPGTMLRDSNIAVTNGGNPNLIYSYPTSSYVSVFTKYAAVSGTNSRAGQIMGIWNASSLEFNEVTTVDIGNTSEVTMSVALANDYIQLSASVQSGTWKVTTMTDFV